MVGWAHHEAGWRGDWDEPLRRQRAVQQAYRELDDGAARRLIQEHGVRYIVVGPLERAYYIDTGLAKFERMAADGLLRVAFDNGEVTIYEVIP